MRYLLIKSKNETVKKFIERKGFDLHFTPNLQRPDGLVKSNEVARNRAKPGAMILDSAHLLAHTMYQTRDNENIQWFSDWGGSNVMTSAL